MTWCPWLAAVWGHAAAPLADELILVLVTRASRRGGHRRPRPRGSRGARTTGARCPACRLRTGGGACCARRRLLRAAGSARRRGRRCGGGRRVRPHRGGRPCADREALVPSMTADPGGVESVGETVQSTRRARRLGSAPQPGAVAGPRPSSRCSSHLRRARRAATGRAARWDRAERRDGDRWPARRPRPGHGAVGVRPAGSESSGWRPWTRCSPRCGARPTAASPRSRPAAPWSPGSAGDGARASVAVERALADDPAYSLALLLAQSLSAGLPPEAWREATAGLTRDECRHGSGPVRARAPRRPAGPLATRRRGRILRRAPARGYSARRSRVPADSSG